MTIDLSGFERYRRAIAPGDLVFFGGNDRDGSLQIPGELLDGAIRGFTDSVISHASMVCPSDWPASILPAGDGPFIIESTIRGTLEGGVTADGVQVNSLDLRLTEYAQQGGRAWWCPLADRVRGFLDFNAMWNVGIVKVNKDAFNIPELFAYLARHIPFVQEIPQLYESTLNMEVCSELVAILLQAGGIPYLKPATMSGQILAEGRIFRDQLQLIGQPLKIQRFNSV